jgi:predicted LPLAT superfamily acyltransferase
MDEKGSLFLMKLASRCYDIFGDRISRYVLNFVSFYYYLFAINAKKNSRQFIKIYQAYCQKKKVPPRRLTPYRHILSFTHMVLDKLAIWKGRITENDFYPGDITALQGLYNANQGALFISSHYGNFEIARAQGRTHSKITYNALIYTRNSQKIFNILKHFSPDIEKTILSVDQLGPGLGAVLFKKITDGEWIFFTGDRISEKSDKKMSARLLGETIRLPQGPFLISYLLKAPVYSFHCYYSKQGYRIQFREITPQIERSRKNRMKFVEKLAANYLQDLEALILNDPSQWFNFYHYWNGVQKSLSKNVVNQL